MEMTKTPIPTKPSNLFSTSLLPLDSRQCQILPLRRGSAGQAPGRVTASVDYKGEFSNVPEGSGKKLVQDP